MKKIFYLLFALCLFVACSDDDNGGPIEINSLEDWLGQLPEKRGSLNNYDFAKKALSKQESNEAIELLKADWLNQIKTKNADSWAQKNFTMNGLEMKFDTRTFGASPADGRSLYISLHGGGNTTEAVNNQQWQNQIGLYKPAEGIYLAPRAPWNDWDMWFKKGIDALFDEVIRTAVAVQNVNPDKVYVMGYSAGGDGIYRIAPRMADRWAAAAMMAGHPGEASQVNLRNTPFCIWMGADDAAYDRNKWAAICGERLDSLKNDDPGGYIHETHIVEGKGHWMDLKDAAAVPWMAQYKRNYSPDKIIWRQENVTLPAFYWLSVPANITAPGMEARVSRSGNTVTIMKNDYGRLIIHLNDEMFDLDNPIIVEYDGKELFNDKVSRNILNIGATLESRGDIRYIFPAQLTVVNNESVE